MRIIWSHNSGHEFDMLTRIFMSLLHHLISFCFVSYLVFIFLIIFFASGYFLFFLILSVTFNCWELSFIIYLFICFVLILFLLNLILQHLSWKYYSYILTFNNLTFFFISLYFFLLIGTFCFSINDW